MHTNRNLKGPLTSCGSVLPSMFSLANSSLALSGSHRSTRIASSLTLLGIVQKVFSPKGVPRIFRRISDPCLTHFPTKQDTFFRKLEKAVAVRNSLLEKFSGKFRRCWKIPHC